MLSYPGLPWINIHHDLREFKVHVRVEFLGHFDTFTMDDSVTAIGVHGANLLKEAYFRRAQLMVAHKIAKELEK